MLWVVSGCGPIVRTPSFPERPEAVKAGSPLGPFEGRVLDADTGQPVSGALVACSWQFSRGMGNNAPESARQADVITDVDGHYRVPQLRDLPVGLSTRLTQFTLLVYKKGYAAFRSDRAFGSDRAQQQFAQRRNLVKLARWSPEMSHAEHLLFIGGGKKMSAASNWEVLAAAAELDARAAKAAPQPEDPLEMAADRTFALDASILLSSDAVRKVTGFGGTLSETRLPGPRSEAYDTFHLRATGQSERYDVAVRIWRVEGTEAEQKYEELLAGLPGSKQKDEVGDRSFWVEQGEIYGCGLLDRAYSSVVLLTCGKGQCAGEAQLWKLAELVAENLQRLPSVGAGNESGTTDGTSTEQDAKPSDAGKTGDAESEGEAAADKPEAPTPPADTPGPKAPAK